ncbi:hypothetical protein D3C71_999520 [compost metagenome]
MAGKIDFYMEVEVADAGSICFGKRGVVLGISTEAGIIKGYAVMLHETDTTIFVARDDVAATGAGFDRADYY